MIRTLDLPGYWYCAAKPDGTWVASPLINGPDPSHVLTNRGRIDLTTNISARGIIWTVIGPGTRFAGSGHSDDHAWEWDGTEWQDRGANEGLHAVMYLPTGQLTVVRETTDAPTGALGWRYANPDGTLVSTIDTYSPTQPLGRAWNLERLWEFTRRGDVIVGQGDIGVEAVINGQRVRLDKLFPQYPDPVNCRAVQFHADGDNLAIAYYFFRSSTDTVSCLIWLTAADLRELMGPAPEPIPAPSTTVPAIPAFDRPMWMAPFYSHDHRWGDTPPNRHVGNAIILVEYEASPGVIDPSVLERELARVYPLGLPLILSGTRVVKPEYLNTTIAWWAIANEGAVNRAMALPEKPVIAYRDDDQWPITKPSWVTDRVWPTVQAYRKPGEAPSTFHARVEAVLQRVAAYGREMGLVTRFDDFNGSGSVAQTLEVMPFYEEWLRKYPIVVHLPFADRRRGGISSDDRLWSWARAFQYAIPAGRPNRFDYWRSSTSDVRSILVNKLGQTRDAVVLEPYLKAEILARFGQPDGPPPHVDAPPPVGSGPFAPNQIEAVRRAMREHPEINPLDDDTRGRILDYAIDALGGAPWGRKARQEDGGRKNTDATCWRLPDGRFEIYDTINGVDPDPGSADRGRFATWDYKGTFKPGENGYWAPHDSVR